MKTEINVKENSLKIVAETPLEAFWLKNFSKAEAKDCFNNIMFDFNAIDGKVSDSNLSFTLLANVDLKKVEAYLKTPEAQAELNRIANEPIKKWPKPTWEQLNTPMDI